MDTVVPHLTEGLIKVCKEVPQDPTEFLANFLLQRADQLDDELMRKRDEEMKAKLSEKKHWNN